MHGTRNEQVSLFFSLVYTLFLIERAENMTRKRVDERERETKQESEQVRERG